MTNARPDPRDQGGRLAFPQVPVGTRFCGSVLSG
jgi:hypothetical protein